LWGFGFLSFALYMLRRMRWRGLWAPICFSFPCFTSLLGHLPSYIADFGCTVLSVHQVNFSYLAFFKLWTKDKIQPTAGASKISPERWVSRRTYLRLVYSWLEDAEFWIALFITDRIPSYS
jgi:hypothetical protein